MDKELTQLAELAEAAEKDGQHIYSHPRDSNHWKENAAWQMAASPEVFSSLIERIKELEADLQMYKVGCERAEAATNQKGQQNG